MRPKGIKVIGFDADDTLWVNEPYYREAEDRFIYLLEAYKVKEDIAAALFKTEMANLNLYGYGIKAFMLSLVECAMGLTQGAVTADTLSKIIEIGKEMLQRPIELLEDVRHVLESLAPRYRLIVATKGDLLDQEGKMRRSGISSFFHHIEVMSDKKEEQYLQLLQHLDILPGEFLMIGNSMKSDILPPLNWDPGPSIYLTIPPGLTKRWIVTRRESGFSGCNIYVRSCPFFLNGYVSGFLALHNQKH